MGGKAGVRVGVDLGGTKIMAGVFNGDFEILGIAKISTKADRGVAGVVDRIARCVSDAVDECDLEMKDVRAVGVGAPGAVDPRTGTVLIAPNLGWENVPLQKQLEKKLGVPVALENDCKVATLGVFEHELQSKPEHLVGIFIGTGIGAGIIINRKMHTGFNGTAGEIGHMVLELDGPKCGCGGRGCFEALASRTAIFTRLIDAVHNGEKTILTEKLGPDLADMRSGDLRKALRKDDKLVGRIVREAATYAGIAVANVINLFNPEVVVLGGGVIEALDDEMMPIITKTARERALPGTARGIEIMASRLADNAGITGAALLTRSG